jgi:hypothetical protein
VRVREMLRMPRQGKASDAAQPTEPAVFMARRVFPRDQPPQQSEMALQAFKSRRRGDYKFQLEYRTRWCVFFLCTLFATDSSKERQRHVPPHEQQHLLLSVCFFTTMSYSG